MDWNKIRKRLIENPEDENPEQNIEDNTEEDIKASDKETSNEDDEKDESPIQIANQSPWSNINKVISPVLNAIIPSADAAKLSEFKPENIKVIRSDSQFNSKQARSKNKQVLPSSDEIKQYIIDQARKKGKDPALVLAHFEKESAFDPGAVNKKGGGTGARGVSQLRGPAFKDVQANDKTGEFQNMTHKDMSNPQNWKKNIDAGLNYYDIVNKYWKPKNEKDFLKNYNQGSFKGRNFDPNEAENYANDVLSRYNKHKEYVNQLDNQRALSNVDVNSGEELAADKMDILGNLKTLMRR